jgi:hypothetical protein
MPEAEQNLVWNLFSSDRERVATAFQRLGPRSASWSSLLNDLLGNYGLEGMAMPYTMEDYKRDSARELLKGLTPEQLLQALTPEQLLKGLPPEQLLSLLPFAEVEKYVNKHKGAQDKNTPELPTPPS